MTDFKKFVLIPHEVYLRQNSNDSAKSRVLRNPNLSAKSKILSVLDRPRKRPKVDFVEPVEIESTKADTEGPSKDDTVNPEASIKEEILADVGGNATTQKRSGLIFDKMMKTRKLKLSDERTIIVGEKDSRIPISTFLYRLQIPFPKKTKTPKVFIDLVRYFNIPEHLVGSAKLKTHLAHKGTELNAQFDERSDEEQYHSTFSDEEDVNRTYTTGEAPVTKKEKYWYKFFEY